MAQTRLQKKAARIDRTATEKEFDELHGQAVRDRDKLLYEARKKFDESMQEARKTLDESRKKAWDEYTAERNEIVEKLAAKEKAA